MKGAELKLTKQSKTNAFNYDVLDRMDTKQGIKMHKVKLDCNFVDQKQYESSPASCSQRSSSLNDKFFPASSDALSCNEQMTDGSAQCNDTNLRPKMYQYSSQNYGWMNMQDADIDYSRNLNQARGEVLEGDRFISVRSANDNSMAANKGHEECQPNNLQTKIELYNINHVQEEQ